MKSTNIRKLVQIAILSAMAFVLYLIRFPLPFMPPFMDFDLTGVPEIAGTFIIGPGAGVVIVAIKILLKVLYTGSTTMLTGDLSNFIVSCAFLLPAGFIYRHYKTRKSALAGMGAGVAVEGVAAVLSNMFLIIPFYIKAFGLSWDQVVAMTNAVNGFVDTPWKFVALGVVPFNIIKYGATTIIAYLLYPVFERIAGWNGKKNAPV